MTPLTTKALEIAGRQVGVRELGRNRGERVEEYQASVGAHPGDPWCSAFVYWCFEHAAREVGMVNPLPRTAGALKLWRNSAVFRRHKEPAPGMVFVMDKGHGLGHVGIVEHVQGLELVTIEGNTDDGGSREGDGVYRRVRKRTAINVGYLDFGGIDQDADTAPIAIAPEESGPIKG